jgi:hypothetical protein
MMQQSYHRAIQSITSRSSQGELGSHLHACNSALKIGEFPRNINVTQRQHAVVRTRTCASGRGTLNVVGTSDDSPPEDARGSHP